MNTSTLESQAKSQSRGKAFHRLPDNHVISVRLVKSTGLFKWTRNGFAITKEEAKKLLDCETLTLSPE